jgi:acyl carrier protein
MANPRDEVSGFMYATISAALNKPTADLSDSTELIADLGAKSVNFVRIIAALEDEYDLEINFVEFRKQKSIGEAIDYVAQL